MSGCTWTHHSTFNIVLLEWTDLSIRQYQPAFYCVINHLVTHNWSLPSQSFRRKSIINDLPSSRQTSSSPAGSSKCKSILFGQWKIQQCRQEHIITVLPLRFLNHIVTMRLKLISVSFTGYLSKERTHLWVWRVYVRRWRWTPSARGGSLLGCPTVSRLSSNRGTAERRGTRSGQTDREALHK